MRIVAERRPIRLGAEELIELGQAPIAAVTSSDTRVVNLSPEEGKLLVGVLEGIISFAKTSPIEFHSYCPTDRWQATLNRVGGLVHEVERQVQAGTSAIRVPADVVFRLVDLEKCVSAARDARIDAAKIAFTLSAGGVIADVLFGLRWLAFGPMLLDSASSSAELAAKLRASPWNHSSRHSAGTARSRRPRIKKRCSSA
jgi:hypothetical protein